MEDIISRAIAISAKGNLHNVMDLGADNTDSTDSTNAFQDAINNGGVYYVPQGTYHTTSAITATGGNVQFVSDGNVVIYADHSGDFLDVSSNASQAPTLTNIIISKRNTYTKTGIAINFTCGGTAGTVGNALHMDNVSISQFDIAISLQGMNWAKIKKSTISNCNTGLYLNGTGTYGSNNGNDFDLEITHCGTVAVNLTGDALGNNFRKLILMSNTLALTADQTGYTIQGLESNTFEYLWCESNTNDFTIKNGTSWVFRHIAHQSTPYFFTSDTAFNNCVIENSMGALSSVPLPGLLQRNAAQYYPGTVLDSHFMSDVSVRQTTEQTMINFPNAKIAHISNEFAVNPIYQMGVAKQNWLGAAAVSGVTTNQISATIDGTWSAPTNSGTITTAQTDPYGGTSAVEFVGANSETHAHFDLSTASGGRTFTFQVLAKANTPSENAQLTLGIESGTNYLRNYIFLNRSGWHLYSVTVPIPSGNATLWVNAHITVNTTDGVLLVLPCFYESVQPGLAQRGNGDGLTVGQNVIIENGMYRTYGTTPPTSGQWAVGDKLINTAPVAGGPDYWVCTTAGNPGTWSASANLA